MSNKPSEDSFFLCRIVGNDLVPRHEPGQARRNVSFILEYEKPLAGCETHWILNRILDGEERRGIELLLEKHKQSYTVLSFDPRKYAKATLDRSRVPPGVDIAALFRSIGRQQGIAVLSALATHKINAAINVNGARNAALALGRPRANWVLPWDGNCFLTEAAWSDIRDAVLQRQRLPYFMAPMARITDNSALLDASFVPDAVEEPQIVFRRDAREKFDEKYPYGHLDKAELLLRLNVPGPWDNWVKAQWGMPRPKPSVDAGKFAAAGWVARLFSGQAEQEVGQASTKTRIGTRAQALVDFIARLDECTDVAAANALPAKLLP